MGRHVDVNNLEGELDAGASLALGSDPGAGGTRFWPEEARAPLEPVDVPSGRAVFSDYLLPHEVLPTGDGDRVALFFWFETHTVAAAFLSAAGASVVTKASMPPIDPKPTPAAQARPPAPDAASDAIPRPAPACAYATAPLAKAVVDRALSSHTDDPMRAPDGSGASGEPSGL
eukprot:5035462-Prymnesium_polylepis.3